MRVMCAWDVRACGFLNQGQCAYVWLGAEGQNEVLGQAGLRVKQPQVMHVVEHILGVDQQSVNSTLLAWASGLGWQGLLISARVASVIRFAKTGTPGWTV